MKNNRTLRISLIVVSIVTILVVVGSMFGTRPAEIPPTPTASFTPLPTMTNTPDPCAIDQVADTISRFDRISREFNDAFVLVQNTPAAQLATGITELQRIRRSAEDYVIPACLNDLKKYQLSFMNSAIDATITLYSNFSGDPNKQLTQEQVEVAVAMVTQSMNDANQYGLQYTAEMGRLLGVTLTPSPTTLPIESLTTLTPVAP